jgi:RHS repeat-associated protein
MSVRDTATMQADSSTTALNVCALAYVFPGKERDAESGNDYFAARYYANATGRFMTPDPTGGSLLNLQTLNRYSYGLNNPLINIDPTGLDCIHVINDTGALESFDSGDCDNSTPELANSGQYR